MIYHFCAAISVASSLGQPSLTRMPHQHEARLQRKAKLLLNMRRERGVYARDVRFIVALS